jgi:hypothetical protein
MSSPLPHGPNSPFDRDEQALIGRIVAELRECETPDAAAAADVLCRQHEALEAMGEVLVAYPSPLDEQTLGGRSRGIDTLVESLCHSSPGAFELCIPTRALLGRALVMAETNFYRFLRHVCHGILGGPDATELAAGAAFRMRLCLYTKLLEELLTALVNESDLELELRTRAVHALAQVWDRRLNYRVRDFFPVLEATWEARQRFTAIGGTLTGTHEMFELFKAGADPRFIDCFTGPDPSPDEIEAFREFLFGATSEELRRLGREMQARGIHSMRLPERDLGPGEDPAMLFYGFFHDRQLQATARRLAGTPGPRRTAEAYVLLNYLRHVE